jgi:hypothetical protein
VAALSHRLIGRGWVEPGEGQAARIVSGILDHLPVPGAVGARGVPQEARRR